MKLWVTTQEGIFSTSFNKEASIKEVLDLTHVQVDAGCRGNGACGLCKIQIIEGLVPKPTYVEQYHLSENELERGIRLACQVMPLDSMGISVINNVQKTISNIVEDYYPEEAFFSGIIPVTGEKHPKYGVCVDLGSTNISLTLWDLNGGKRLAGRYIANQDFPK